MGKSQNSPNCGNFFFQMTFSMWFPWLLPGVSHRRLEYPHAGSIKDEPTSLLFSIALVNFGCTFRNCSSTRACHHVPYYWRNPRFLYFSWPYPWRSHKAIHRGIFQYISVFSIYFLFFYIFLVLISKHSLFCWIDCEALKCPKSC